MDKRAAVVLSVIFGGLFLALFGSMFLAWSAVKGASPLSLDGDSGSSSTGPRIGIVEVKGTIGDGQNGVDGDKLVQLLRKYGKDDDIKAVLLRIDSPGGAVAPSQEAYEAVRALRKKKKVVVSMGNLAASGGYYIASAADWIIANPGTLTGSIGVIFMHFNVRGLLETLKVDETTIKSGKYKDALSPFRAVSDTDQTEIQGISDDVYGQFVHDVADGRGLKEDEVRQLAEGRIYTGKRAKELKLVDELGSFQDAIDKAWSLAQQTGEPRFELPGKNHEFSLRDLMRGAFQGAGAGVAEGAMQGMRSGFFGGAAAGPAFLAPALVQ